MSAPSPVGVIAEALAKHHAVGMGICNCGWSTETKLGHSWREKHEAHQASVIAALPNIAIVALPKGTVRKYGGLSWGADEDDEYPTVTATPGYDTVRLYVEDARHTRDAAVEAAGFLLAAARAAGGES